MIQLPKKASIRAVEEEIIEFSEAAPYCEGRKQREGKKRIWEYACGGDDEEEEE